MVVRRPAGPRRAAGCLAAEGHVPDGYQVLLLGRQRALEGEANFAPSAEELEGRWDAAIERYADRYGVGRAPPAIVASA